MDKLIMNFALKLAKNNISISKPNPSIACIIIKNYKIISKSVTSYIGNYHAEVNAIINALKKKKKIINSTIYITLEPCNYFNNTISCLHSIIKYRIKKIIYCMNDTNKLISSKSYKKLKENNFEISYGILKRKAYSINIYFFKKKQYNQQWFRLKTACSLDFKLALSNKKSKWITNNKSRIKNQIYRNNSCCLIIGIGTILNDNPKMNVRYIKNIKQPIKIILDNNLLIPLNSIILKFKKIIIFTKIKNLKTLILKKMGIKIYYICKKNNIIFILNKIFNMNTNLIQIESGTKINTTFINTKILDELIIYIAPIFLGESKYSVFNFNNILFIKNMKDKLNLNLKKIIKNNNDLQLNYRF